MKTAKKKCPVCGNPDVPGSTCRYCAFDPKCITVRERWVPQREDGMFLSGLDKSGPEFTVDDATYGAFAKDTREEALDFYELCQTADPSYPDEATAPKGLRVVKVRAISIEVHEVETPTD